ncbi:hypothetical protein D3C87_1180180 [compost metagenome]
MEQGVHRADQRHQFRRHVGQFQRRRVTGRARGNGGGERAQRPQRHAHGPHHQRHQQRHAQHPRQHLGLEVGHHQFLALGLDLSHADPPAFHRIVQVIEPPRHAVDGDVGEALHVWRAGQAVAVRVDMQRFAAGPPRGDGEIAQPRVAHVAQVGIAGQGAVLGRRLRHGANVDQRQHGLHLLRHAHHGGVVQLVDFLLRAEVDQHAGKAPGDGHPQQHGQDQAPLQGHASSPGLAMASGVPSV